MKQVKRDRLRFSFDIDGVIFPEHPGGFITECTPYKQAVEIISELHAAGHTIILHTARPYRLLETTIKQLAKYKIPYHTLVMGKPSADFIIDDRAIPFKNWAFPYADHFIKALKIKIEAKMKEPRWNK